MNTFLTGFLEVQVDPTSIIPSISQVDWADDIEGVSKQESVAKEAELHSSKTLLDVNETSKPEEKEGKEGFRKWRGRGRGRGRGGYSRRDQGQEKREGEQEKPRERREYPKGEKKEIQKTEGGEAQPRTRRPYRPRPEKREQPTAAEA
jgi:hypothetical protein